MGVTSLVMSLYWQLIQTKSDFKILLFTCKALNGLAPSYIYSLISH